MFNLKRNLEYAKLTATTTAQTFNPSKSSIATQIRVINGGGIRLQINGNPANLTSSNGIYVSKDNNLILHDFVVNELKYIRDINATSDVDFEFVGMRVND